MSDVGPLRRPLGLDLRVFGSAALLAASSAHAVMQNADICTASDGSVVEACTSLLDRYDKEANPFKRLLLLPEAREAFRTRTKDQDFSSSQLAAWTMKGSCDGRDQTAELKKFADGNLGKFSKEIGQLPRVFIVKVPAGAAALDGVSYDSTVGEMQGFRVASPEDVWLSQSCRAVGSYTAATAYGAKTTVRREECIRWVLRDVSAWQASAPKGIPLSSDEFRIIKSSGFSYTFVFSIGEAVASEVVTSERVRFEPTWHDPVDRVVQIQTISGSVLNTCFIAKAGLLKFAELSH